MSEEKLVTAQVAAELGISRWAVWKYIKNDRLKAAKMGRDYVIDRDDLEAFKAERRNRPPNALGRKPKT